MSIFGERLRELRKQRNFTADEVAEIIDVKRRTLVNYESGDREPTFGQLIALADFLGVTVDYLIGRASKYDSVLSPRLSGKFQDQMRKIREKYGVVDEFATSFDYEMVEHLGTALYSLLHEIQKEFCSGDEQIKSNLSVRGFLRFTLKIGQTEEWVEIFPVHDDGRLSVKTFDSRRQQLSLIEFIWPDDYDLAKDVILSVLLKWYERVLKNIGQSD